MSNDRFSQLEVDSKTGFSVSIVGAPFEKIHMMVGKPSGYFFTVECTLSTLGTARFSTVNMGCSDNDIAVALE